MGKKLEELTKQEIDEIGFNAYRTIERANQIIMHARQNIAAIEQELKRREEKNGCELQKD